MSGVRVKEVVFLSPSVAFLLCFRVPVALVEALYSLCNNGNWLGKGDWKTGLVCPMIEGKRFVAVGTE